MGNDSFTQYGVWTGVSVGGAFTLYKYGGYKFWKRPLWYALTAAGYLGVYLMGDKKEGPRQYTDDVDGTAFGNL